MQKIKLNIAALVRSDVHPNSYVIILKEESGNRRLPILIGAFEAQAIVMALEQVETNRPLTHDLFKHTLSEFNIELQEVVISELKEGIFFATLFCTAEDGQVMGIDSRTSDAIALAVRFSCPIFVNSEIIDEAGIILEEGSEEVTPSTTADAEKDLEDYDLEELQDLLDQALKTEDYETAAKIRDEIRKREED